MVAAQSSRQELLPPIVRVFEGQASCAPKRKVSRPRQEKLAPNNGFTFMLLSCYTGYWRRPLRGVVHLTDGKPRRVCRYCPSAPTNLELEEDEEIGRYEEREGEQEEHEGVAH